MWVPKHGKININDQSHSVVTNHEFRSRDLACSTHLNSGGGEINNINIRFLHHFLRFILLDTHQLFGSHDHKDLQHCLPKDVELYYFVPDSMTETPDSFS